MNLQEAEGFEETRGSTGGLHLLLLEKEKQEAEKSLKMQTITPPIEGAVA